MVHPGASHLTIVERVGSSVPRRDEVEQDKTGVFSAVHSLTHTRNRKHERKGVRGVAKNKHRLSAVRCVHTWHSTALGALC